MIIVLQMMPVRMTEGVAAVAENAVVWLAMLSF
jgi:hypothetical protein